MSIRLGLVGPLPPAPTGPADYMGNLLPPLARHAEVSCFVENPDEVDPALRASYSVRALAERHDTGVDLLIYHLANNPYQIPAVDAALEGPPGLIELHDGSQHHLVEHRYAAADPDRYAAVLAAAHPQGGEIVRRRLHGFATDVERFLFDALRPCLVRHRGVIVHNRWSADLVGLRCPGLPVWVVPHFAPSPPDEAITRTEAGLPETAFVVGHFGYVTIPKRPVLLVEALARLVRDGIDAHLLFAGEAEAGTLSRVFASADQLGMSKRITVTGYLPRQRMDALMSVTDVVVSMRFPHLGESSGTVVEAMAAGRPLVVQDIGSWAEIPESAAVRVPIGGDEVTALANALATLRDPALRAAMGAAGREYATTVLDRDHCAGLIVKVAEEVAAGDPRSFDERMRSRASSVRFFLHTGPARLREALASTRPAEDELNRVALLLAAIPPAHPGARLLEVAANPARMRLYSLVWGYEVRGSIVGPSTARAATVAVPPGAGLPGYVAEVDMAHLWVEGLPYEAGEFDVVVCQEVAGRIEGDPADLLREVNRVLRPGGVLVLGEPNAASYGGIAELLEERVATRPTRPSSSLPTGRATRRYSPAGVRRLLRSAGFSDDGVRTTDSEDGWAPVVAVVRGAGASQEDRGAYIVAAARKSGLPDSYHPEEA